MEQEQQQNKVTKFIDLGGLWSSSTGKSFSGNIELSKLDNALSSLDDSSKSLTIVVTPKSSENPKAPVFSVSAKIVQEI